MPNVFTLTKKGETKRSSFQDVDKEMCEFFNEPVDEKKWYCGWYGYIGQLCAFGNSFEDIRNLLKEDIVEGSYGWADHMIKIVDWMEERYTTDCWYEHK